MSLRAGSTAGPPQGTAVARLADRLRGDRWRLSSRIAAVSILILLLLQLLGFAAIRASIERNARLQLDAQLGVGARLVDRLLEQRAAKLGQAAALLAADYGFRSAVGSDDRATIASALDNHGARIRATVAALLDTRLQPKAVTAAAGDDALLPTLVEVAPRLADRGSAVATVGDRPVQFVIAPVRAPLVVAWVVVGVEVERALVDDLHAMSGLHGSLVWRPGTDDARVLLSSLPEASPALALALCSPEDAANDPHWRQRTLPVAGSTTGIVLQLAGSIDAATEPYRELQWFLGALTLLGLVLFGLASAWSARRVAQPLRTLVDAADRLGRGHYDGPVGHTARGDEIGELARAFEHMRVNIDASQREIRQLAYWDRLTGLPNRLQFGDAVLARTTASPAPLAVVMLDLDRFKHVNDVLGYVSGDRLLQGVAQRLQHVVREGDLVARLGGDEFALLLPQADAATATAVAARIAAEFEAPLVLDDQTVDLSAAIGIACWPDHAAEADALLSRAEVAMYAAKRRGSGAVLYDASLDSGSALTLTLLGELRRAVEGGELRMFLQPKVSLADGRLIGAEALVRWQHPRRGMVPPVQFIPFAEQTGFVRQLTLWMFEQVAMRQKALQAMGIGRVSVNLSTRDLLDLELPDKLERILQRHGARSGGMCLEITESAIMDDPERAEATINRLAARGYRLSIDDFGTGYSSLAYLRRLPVEELKIDRSFVMGMAAGGDDDAKIVRSTIDLAHNLGLTVVAEGVEDAAVLDRLALLGCDEAQGFHLSRPLDWDAFTAWVGSWGAGWQAPQRRGPLVAGLVGDADPRGAGRVH